MLYKIIQSSCLFVFFLFILDCQRNLCYVSVNAFSYVSVNAFGDAYLFVVCFFQYVFLVNPCEMGKMFGVAKIKNEVRIYCRAVVLDYNTFQNENDYTQAAPHYGSAA